MHPSTASAQSVPQQPPIHNAAVVSALDLCRQLADLFHVTSGQLTIRYEHGVPTVLREGAGYSTERLAAMYLAPEDSDA